MPATLPLLPAQTLPPLQENNPSNPISAHIILSHFHQSPPFPRHSLVIPPTSPPVLRQSSSAPPGRLPRHHPAQFDPLLPVQPQSRKRISKNKSLLISTGNYKICRRAWGNQINGCFGDREGERSQECCGMALVVFITESTSTRNSRKFLERRSQRLDY